MSREETMYLRDISQSCEKIMRYATGLTQADLLRDDRTYDAVVRNLEIIGEAAKKLSEEIKCQMPQIEWRKIAGLRDILAHAYFGVDNDILWDILQNKVSELAEAVNAFIEASDKD
jgi:uncharacterized protein with HEPN domain